MSSQMAQLQEATIKAQCKTLRMPMTASQFGTLAEQAIREKKSHIGYLEALLLAEIEERERNTIERRIREAHLPRLKTLEEFDYTQSPNVTAAKMRDLAEGGYIERAEPVLFIGECGTGREQAKCGHEKFDGSHDRLPFRALRPRLQREDYGNAAGEASGGASLFSGTTPIKGCLRNALGRRIIDR